MSAEWTHRDNASQVRIGLLQILVIVILIGVADADEATLREERRTELLREGDVVEGVID